MTEFEFQFQLRVITERLELGTKVARLEAFIAGQVFPTIPHEEQTRLNTQLGYMRGYLAVLVDRITAFNQG